MDWYSVNLNSYVGIANQRWELIYVSNGYYRIKNSNSGKYLTAPSNSNNGSPIEQSNLSSAQTNRQLWKFIPTYEGSSDYLLQAKSQEAYDLYASCSSNMGIYGYEFIQSYDVQYIYTNEWNLERAKKATLIGINHSTYSHSASINFANDNFSAEGMETNALNPESISKTTVLSYMESSDIFILFSHGSWDNDGTYINVDESGLNYLHTSDIYNYNGDSDIGPKVDLSDCELLIWAGCYTAMHSSKNLPLASVHAGAESSIGFNCAASCDDLSNWIISFSGEYASSAQLDFSIDIANQNSNENVFDEGVYLYTQGG